MKLTGKDIDNARWLGDYPRRADVVEVMKTSPNESKRDAARYALSRWPQYREAAKHNTALEHEEYRGCR